MPTGLPLASVINGSKPTLTGAVNLCKILRQLYLTLVSTNRINFAVEKFKLKENRSCFFSYKVQEHTPLLSSKISTLKLCV